MSLGSIDLANVVTMVKGAWLRRLALLPDLAA